VTRARVAGLATEADPIVAEYALVADLVIVTFDRTSVEGDPPAK
jgi:hypothetical protein